MIGKATVFAFLMLAPGLAFAADSAATASAPVAAAHEKADSTATVKPDAAKTTSADKKAAVKTVKTAKAKTHKAKAAPGAEKKTDSKS